MGRHYNPGTPSPGASDPRRASVTTIVPAPPESRNPTGHPGEPAQRGRRPDARQAFFRLMFRIVVAPFVPFGLCRRIRSRTDEKLDRWQEGSFILFGLRLSGLPLLTGVITWLIDPEWMAWSSMPIPVWLRSAGLGMVGASGLPLVGTFRHLGTNLTATVVTRREHTLMTTGPDRHGRHSEASLQPRSIVGEWHPHTGESLTACVEGQPALETSMASRMGKAGSERLVAVLEVSMRWIPRRRRSWTISFLAGVLISAAMPATGWLSGGAGTPARAGEHEEPEDLQHWAFQPIRRPGIPVVQDTAWVRNPIDAFVLAGLEESGWTPSPPADPAALLRRIHLGVSGLPPTPEEVRAFLEDPSPESLNHVVDDLLARPSYGERWGRHWLDLVRFAETNGYERDDLKPFAWKYRDYVICSLNEDKPFDRFILEQLAGDELPDATAETWIATGFNRLGPWDDEPADPKQDRFDQLDDLVRTTSGVFLGLTLGCARCHDHKFEPLTTLDYTRMVAIFDPLRRPQAGRPRAGPTRRNAGRAGGRRPSATGRSARPRAGSHPCGESFGRSSSPAIGAVFQPRSSRRCGPSLRRGPNPRRRSLRPMRRRSARNWPPRCRRTCAVGSRQSRRRSVGSTTRRPTFHSATSSRRRRPSHPGRVCSSGARRLPPARRSSRACRRFWFPSSRSSCHPASGRRGGGSRSPAG